MREGHALGVTRRARGVDDGCDVRGRDGGATLLNVLNGDAGGCAGDHALCAAIEGIDGDGMPGGNRAHELGLLRRGREDAGHVRVGEDVLDLGGGIGLVDRDGDRADREQCQIQEEPLVRGRGQDRHSVSSLHAEADEATGGVFDLTLELTGGQRAGGSDGGTLLDAHLLRVGEGPLGQHVGHDVVVADLVRRLDRVRAIAHALHRVLRDVGSKTEQQVRCESTGCGAAPAP